MKVLFTILALFCISLATAQKTEPETKKACCQSKKECSASDKKDCKDHKSCDTKGKACMKEEKKEKSSAKEIKKAA